MNKIITHYIVLFLRHVQWLSFFQTPAHDCESNPHAILIDIWFFSPPKL